MSLRSVGRCRCPFNARHGHLFKVLQHSAGLLAGLAVMLLIDEGERVLEELFKLDQGGMYPGIGNPGVRVFSAEAAQCTAQEV